MRRHRATIFIGNLFHARSFFSGTIYEDFTQNFELQMILAPEVQDYYSERILGNLRIETSKREKDLARLMLDASLVRNVTKSSSFRFRLRRFVLGDYRRIMNFSPTGIIRLLTAISFAIPGLYGYLCRLYRAAYLSNKGLNESISNFKPDVIIAWATTIEPSTMLCIDIAKRIGCKSICVFDNWDNLSSKAVMLKTPDFLICFGEQTKQLAIRIHNIEPDKVIPLGSARFDSYLDSKSVNRKNRRKILIVGSSIALEDKKILEEISKFIDFHSKKIAEEGLYFTYRPHPAPQGMSLDLESWKFPEISLDESWNLASEGSNNWQSQIEISGVLNECKFVIAAPTTLLLEALICGNRVLIPALKIFKVKTSIRKMLKYLEHLKGLEEITGVSISYTKEAFSKTLFDLCFNEMSDTHVSSPDTLITTTPGTFAHRFLAFTRELVQSTSK